jgi:hypothetical protein
LNNIFVLTGERNFYETCGASVLNAIKSGWRATIGLLHMNQKKSTDKFTKKEAQTRFEAALKGALSTSPKPLKDKPMVKKKPKSRAKKRD